METENIRDYVLEEANKGNVVVKYRMWTSINDKNKEMPNNEDMFIKMENGEVRRYNEDWEEEFMLDGIVTHWMPIPKLVK